MQKEYRAFSKTKNLPGKSNVCNSFGSASYKPKIKRHFETMGEFWKQIGHHIQELWLTYGNGIVIKLSKSLSVTDTL